MCFLGKNQKTPQKTKFRENAGYLIFSGTLSKWKVKGGVDGVDESDDREQEDDVGKGGRQGGCRGRASWLAARLAGEPRGGLRSGDEGNQVVDDVGGGEAGRVVRVEMASWRQAL